MRGRDRAALRAKAHHLTPALHVGQQGLTDAVLSALDDALAARELVKIQLSRQAPLDAKQAAASLASRLEAEVVQVIGRTVTLYREKREEGGGKREE